MILRTLVQPFLSLKNRFFFFFFFFSSFPPHRFHLAVRGSGKSILLNSHHDHNNFRSAQPPKIPAGYTAPQLYLGKSAVHLNKTSPASFSLLLYHGSQSYQLDDESSHAQSRKPTRHVSTRKISSDIPPLSPPYSITSTHTSQSKENNPPNQKVYITQHNPETPAQCTPPSQLQLHHTKRKHHTHTYAPTPPLSPLPPHPTPPAPTHLPTHLPTHPPPPNPSLEPPPQKKQVKPSRLLNLFHLYFTEEKDK